MTSSKEISPDIDNPAKSTDVNLYELIHVLWANKIIYFISFVASVFLALFIIYRTDPSFKAETVIEKPGDRNDKGELGIGLDPPASIFLSSLVGTNISKTELDHLSVISSDTFLHGVIFNNDEIDKDVLTKACPSYEPPAPFSIGSLWITLGISEKKFPSDAQQQDRIIACVEEMINIAYFTYGSDQTKAIKITVTSPGPNFSSTLANEIVKKYFAREQAIKQDYLRKIKAFLANTISISQDELSEAKNDLQNFIVKHALLGNIKTVDANNIEISPFNLEMKSKIKSLGQIERSQNQFNDVKNKLLELKEKEPENINQFISTIEPKGILSRKFISATMVNESLSPTLTLKNPIFLNKLNEEVRRLDDQIELFNKKIKKREVQTLELMNIENRYQELLLDVQKKAVVFEGLKSQLNQKVLEEGISQLTSPVLLSKAVPPILPSAPNKKLILALVLTIFMFLATGYILLRQISMKKIYVVDQIKRMQKSYNVLVIKNRELKRSGSKSIEDVIDTSFLTVLKKAGQFGCIIDLSRSSHSNTLSAKLVSNSLSELFNKNNESVALINLKMDKFIDPIFSKEQKDSGQQSISEGILSDNLKQLNKDIAYPIDIEELSKVQTECKIFDRVLLPLSCVIDDLTKLEMLDKCDFYIFIGKTAQCDELAIKRFSNKTWEREKKCLAFFLIA